jgi:hypothetical protein
MKSILILLSSCLLFLHCSKDDFHINKIRGSWVESETGLDTIIFHDSDLEGFFTLNRPKEVQNGQLLPLHGAGMYFYSIENDSISMQFALLSCWCPKQFPFRIYNNRKRITIGNFYDANKPEEDMLIFERL